jgi:hypothetical protein
MVGSVIRESLTIADSLSCLLMGHSHYQLEQSYGLGSIKVQAGCTAMHVRLDS